MSWKVANKLSLMVKGPAVPKGDQSNRLPGSPGDEAVIGTEKSRKIPSMAVVIGVNIMKSLIGEIFEIDLEEVFGSFDFEILETEKINCRQGNLLTERKEEFNILTNASNYASRTWK